MTGLAHNISGYPATIDPKAFEDLITRIINKIELNEDKICKSEVVNPDADLIIVAFGLPSRAALEVVKNDSRIGLFRPITLWPFPGKDLMRIAEGKKILVLEMNAGQIVREIERFAGRKNVRLFSKLGGVVHRPAEIMETIKKWGVL